jgi:hypothetical protein
VTAILFLALAVPPQAPPVLVAKKAACKCCGDKCSCCTNCPCKKKAPAKKKLPAPKKSAPRRLYFETENPRYSMPAPRFFPRAFRGGGGC